MRNDSNKCMGSHDTSWNLSVTRQQSCHLVQINISWFCPNWWPINWHVITKMSQKKHLMFGKNQYPGAACKISDRVVKIIIWRVVQEPSTTCGELQNDLESAVSKKTVSNGLNLHGLYPHSPGETPLLKKRQVEAYLKFVEWHSDKPVKYWQTKVWPHETKTELFGCHNTDHV